MFRTGKKYFRAFSFIVFSHLLDILIDALMMLFWNLYFQIVLEACIANKTLTDSMFIVGEQTIDILILEIMNYIFVSCMGPMHSWCSINIYSGLYPSEQDPDSP